MQRFFTSSDVPLPPGAKVRLQDGRVAQVVISAEPEYEGREFLAVTASGGTGAPDGATNGEATAGVGDALDTPLVTASTLPLPYTLPT